MITILIVLIVAWVISKKASSRFDGSLAVISSAVAGLVFCAITGFIANGIAASLMGVPNTFGQAFLGGIQGGFLGLIISPIMTWRIRKTSHS